MTTDHMQEALAQKFHEFYENLAPVYGYKTREASAVPWSEVPDANKRLMTAVASNIIDWLGLSRIQSELKRLQHEHNERIANGHDGSCLAFKAETLAELSQLREELAFADRVADRLRASLSREREMRDELSKERKEHADERDRLREENERHGHQKCVPVAVYERAFHLPEVAEADRLRKIEEAAKQALRTLDAAHGSRQLASDVLRNALKEVETTDA